jgi:hypothetical protein
LTLLRFSSYFKGSKFGGVDVCNWETLYLTLHSETWEESAGREVLTSLEDQRARQLER